MALDLSGLEQSIIPVLHRHHWYHHSPMSQSDEVLPLEHCQWSKAGADVSKHAEAQNLLPGEICLPSLITSQCESSRKDKAITCSEEERARILLTTASDYQST